MTISNHGSEEPTTPDGKNDTAACGPGCGCGSPGLSIKGKIIVCLIVGLAAAFVLARGFDKNTGTDRATEQAFATAVPIVAAEPGSAGRAAPAPIENVSPGPVVEGEGDEQLGAVSAAPIGETEPGAAEQAAPEPIENDSPEPVVEGEVNEQPDAGSAAQAGEAEPGHAARAAPAPIENVSPGPVVEGEGDEQPDAGSAAPAGRDAAEPTGTESPGSALWGQPLASLADLNKVAAAFDAVFVLLPADNDGEVQAIREQIEAAADKLTTQGVTMAAYTLARGTQDYAQVTGQVPAPCVLAMVKGRGMVVVSQEFTEGNLLQAVVAASRPSGCAPSGCGPSGCP